MPATSKATPPEIEVLFGTGKKKLAHFEAIWVETRHAANQIPAAKLVLTQPGRLVADTKPVSDDAKICRPGQDVTVKIKSGPVLFTGIVVQQELRMTQGATELTLKLRHNLQRLNNVLRSQVFEKLSDADIVRKIFAEHKVKPGKIDGLTIKHPQMVQFASSDWQFLMARLGANGVWLMAEADAVDIIEPKLKGKAEHTFKQKDNDADLDLEEAFWQYSSDGQPQSLEAVSWDVKLQKMTTASKAKAPSLGRGGFDPGALEALSNTPWLLTNNISMPTAEQMALAESRLLRQQATGVQGSFTVTGSTAYSLGQTVALSGFGAHFDGAGVISEVRQRMVQGEWRTTVSIGQDQLRSVDAAPLPRAPGLHIGIVDSYKADPDGLNRLRIKVPALKLDTKPLWARFSAPYASKESGLCLYPEEGDEVVIGFFDDDPRYPVILGSMHNPKNKAPYAPSKENDQKGLVFVNKSKKHQLLFDVQKSTLELSIEKQKLRIENGKQIELSGDAEINLKAQKKLNAQGTQGVTIKGSKVDLTN